MRKDMADAIAPRCSSVKICVGSANAANAAVLSSMSWGRLFAASKKCDTRDLRDSCWGVGRKREVCGRRYTDNRIIVLGMSSSSSSACHRCIIPPPLPLSASLSPSLFLSLSLSIYTHGSVFSRCALPHLPVDNPVSSMPVHASPKICCSRLMKVREALYKLSMFA